MADAVANDTSDLLRATIAPLVGATGGPVTALRAIQADRGWIDPAAIEVVADVFNLGRAEVRGLVAFYADFRTLPPAEHTVAVCQAEACQAAGSRSLTRTLEQRLGAELGRVRPDRRVALEPVYCLGLCARAPAVTVDGRLVVDADTAVERIVARVEP